MFRTYVKKLLSFFILFVCFTMFLFVKMCKMSKNSFMIYKQTFRNFLFFG